MSRPLHFISASALPALLLFHSLALADLASTEIATRAIAKLKSSSAIEEVQIDKADPRVFSYSIRFKKGQGTEARARAETSKLISTTLQLLVKSGVSPSDDWVSAHAKAFEPVQGETGKRLVKDFGSSHYNFALDRIEFKRASD